MSGYSCYFFADNRDLANLLEAFSDLGDYKYVQIRSKPNEPNLIFFEPKELLSLAIVTPSNPTRCQSFLVLEKGQEHFDREISLRDGTGIRRVIDQNQNWNSIVLALGGEAGDQTLIMSDINTVGDTEIAVEMHKKFKKLVASKSRKVGAKRDSYRLMPGAIEKLKAGWRLASDKSWLPSTGANISPEEIAVL